MKLNHKITIDLLEFIRSGKFDYIRLGKTKEWILANFADPDGLGEFPGVYEHDIWCYGNLEFHFNGNDLFLIFSDYINTLSGGDSLELEKWIFSEPEKLNLAFVIEHLNRHRINFRLEHHLYGQMLSAKLTILNSGVALSFSPDEEKAPDTNSNGYKLDSMSLMNH